MMAKNSSLGSAVVGRGGSVADKGPRPRSGGGRRGLTLYYSRPGRTGRVGLCTTAVAEADKKREVGANSEEVK